VLRVETVYMLLCSLHVVSTLNLSSTCVGTTGFWQHACINTRVKVVSFDTHMQVL